MTSAANGSVASVRLSHPLRKLGAWMFAAVRPQHGSSSPTRPRYEPVKRGCTSLTSRS